MLRNQQTVPNWDKGDRQKIEAWEPILDKLYQFPLMRATDQTCWGGFYQPRRRTTFNFSKPAPKCGAFMGKQCWEGQTVRQVSSALANASGASNMSQCPVSSSAIADSDGRRRSGIFVDITSTPNGIYFNITRGCIYRENHPNFTNSESVETFPFSFHLFNIKFCKRNDALFFNRD
ncbi:hypothetical protein MiSe_73940 [Microseira wollei NIES-4236]|uniref:Uncharacterized protein n=1 Tax=Microseira wollei NIES-4236 TaxID=2530354 RepID=A0AAV3XLQ9_9CYAN|nr:hypothetical protein MiSe_73940 [Microseira wollei NIES-4236]